MEIDFISRVLRSLPDDVKVLKIIKHSPETKPVNILTASLGVKLFSERDLIKKIYLVQKKKRSIGN